MTNTQEIIIFILPFIFSGLHLVHQSHYSSSQWNKKGIILRNGSNESCSVHFENCSKVFIDFCKFQTQKRKCLWPRGKMWWRNTSWNIVKHDGFLEVTDAYRKCYLDSINLRFHVRLKNAVLDRVKFRDFSSCTVLRWFLKMFFTFPSCCERKQIPFVSKVIQQII